ncbi:MAG: DUF971 domain-containing protein [Planctomycetota bacterium]
MSNVPIDIRALREAGVLAVQWPDRKVDLPFTFLRGQCACAQCVNEWTGERILDPATIPPDISIEKMELVGSYAVRIHWTDQHNSGLFTWERLREVANFRP